MYLYEPGRESIRPGDLSGPGGYGGGDGDFREQDLAWIAGWGFDFIRLPLDYRFWTRWDDKGRWHVREEVLARIDRIIDLARHYHHSPRGPSFAPSIANSRRHRIIPP